MKVSEWIKTIRNENNLSQLELGERINVTQNTISQYETEARNIDMQIISALAKEFNYQVNIEDGTYNFVKIGEEIISMCDWCLAVIEEAHDTDECPYCKNKGYINTGALKIPNGSKFIKRKREVVLCQSNNKYTPYSVSLVSAHNGKDKNVYFSLCHGDYCSTIESALKVYERKVKKYSYIYGERNSEEE